MFRQIIFTVDRAGQIFLIILLKFYRYLVSPWLGNHCRFFPSCSHYAIKAIQVYGVVKGCYLTFLRLLRCHPWNDGGYDPLPDSKNNRLLSKPSSFVLLLRCVAFSGAHLLACKLRSLKSTRLALGYNKRDQNTGFRKKSNSHSLKSKISRV